MLDIAATYLMWMIKKKITPQDHQQPIHQITPNDYIKPNPKLNYKTGELYYYFINTEKTKFEDANETFSANTNLLKQDLIQELEETSNLYHINDDGSFSISKITKF